MLFSKSSTINKTDKVNCENKGSAEGEEERPGILKGTMTGIQSFIDNLRMNSSLQITRRIESVKKDEDGLALKDVPPNPSNFDRMHSAKSMDSSRMDDRAIDSNTAVQSDSRV
ncbi:MAG: hypothetical protein Q9157_004238 [Trypethelium eluteriae]